MPNENQAFTHVHQRKQGRQDTAQYLQEVTGLTPNMLRQSLQRSMMSFVDDVQQRATRLEQSTPPTDRSEGMIGSTPQALPMKPFVASGTSDSGGAGQPSDSGQDIEDVIIVFNGTAFYCSLKGTVGEEVT